MQAEAHFQDPACPTVHVVSTDIKRRLRWSSRALAVESPNPLDATVWDQSLVYVVRRGWEQSDPSPVHHLALLRAMGRPCTETRMRHGWQQANPWRKHKGVPRLHTLQMVNKPGLCLPLQKHSGGAQAAPLPSAPPWYWSATKRWCAKQAALLQVHCVPYSDTETGPEAGSDPVNSHDCWIIPPNPTEQLWGVQGEDKEIKHAINVCRIKLEYLLTTEEKKKMFPLKIPL